VRSDWLIRAHWLGQTIQVRLDNETVTGRFAELDETGALIVETAPGVTRQITAGDVYFPGAH
jgi:BirA family biotin operon repressor/biotin-[acetyl-CoA-carboxylase] ligase